MKKIILIYAGIKLLEIPDIFFRASRLQSFNAQSILKKSNTFVSNKVQQKVMLFLKGLYSFLFYNSKTV